MTILEGSSFSVAPPTPAVKKRGGKIYVCFLKFHLQRKQFCSVKAAALLHFNEPKHNRITKCNRVCFFISMTACKHKWKPGLNSSRGIRPLLRPGSSSLSARMVSQSCLYFCHKSGSIFTSTSCSSTWGIKTTPNTITTPKTNIPTLITHQNPTATQKQHDSPTQCLHFWSQAKDFLCTGGLYKLLKWMLKFGGLNHNFLETNRTLQFLNTINLLQQEECNFFKVASLSALFA